MNINEYLFIYFDTIILYLYWFIFLIFTGTINIIPAWQNVFIQFNPVENATYDYIIVGAGTAGSIIAARLSENPNVNVLLLEAGVTKPDLLNVPILGPMLHGTEFDWCYVTTPQKDACLAMNENRSSWPRGRLLGGTAHLNFMMYTPGHLADYESWIDPTTGDWSASDVELFFTKSVSGDAKIVPIRQNPYYETLSDAILAGAETLGVPTLTSNFDLKTNSGFLKPSFTMHESGKRWTADQYLNEIRSKRSNLFIRTGSKVSKILINDHLKATGVEVIINGEKSKIFSSKEIILSAGTIGSPHLLMLSGVGPSAVLAAANIKTVVNSPVGENLQDHITTGLDLLLSSNNLLHLGELVSMKSAFNYFAYGTGPYSTSFCEAVGLLPSSSLSPQLELMVLLAGLSTDMGLANRYNFGIRDEVWSSYFSPLVNIPSASILPVLLHPKSSGTVRLNSNNPEDAPVIDPKYLSQNEDVEILVDGLEWIYKLAKTDAMRNAGFAINDRHFPGCHDYQFAKRDYWRCYVRQLTLSSFHPVGTCRMGSREDESSVVDHQLRVHGIANLRVADASIMPNLPSANIHAAVIMIAEKASDLIKRSWK